MRVETLPYSFQLTFLDVLNNYYLCNEKYNDL